MFLWYFYIKINFYLHFTHKMTISQFLRACSHYDIIVRSYINGWYLFWYQWKEEVHTNTPVVNVGYVRYTFIINNPGGVATTPPFGKYVWEKGEQGLKGQTQFMIKKALHITCHPGCKDSVFNVLFLVLEFPLGALFPESYLSTYVSTVTIYYYITCTKILVLWLVDSCSLF